MKLDLQSERYAATGNISGAGIQKSLGTPTLDRLQILIREAAQNSWDARQDGSVVIFRVHVRTLTLAQQRALSSLMSVLPACGPTREQVEKSLGRPSLNVIEISDHGTTGLGGPSRADEKPHARDGADFVNFFRNVGSPRDRHLGAGTYGYGKSAMYRLSRCGTIIGYTQATCAGRNVTRLMAASIGNTFEHEGHRYTGRHWWGQRKEDQIVEPLEGGGAHSVASSLGLDRRDTNDPGTSVLIIDPEFEERTLSQAGNAVTECIAWFFWPKMISDARGCSPMNFEVLVDGVALGMPNIRDFPPLEIFAEAMATAKATDAVRVRCERPIQELGRLGFAKGPRLNRRWRDTGTEYALVPERCGCVALMRPAELVVKYLPGPLLASDMVEYAGVFICNDEVEPYFAEAEPPAHDDWIPDFLEGRGKTFVRVALRRIAEAMDRYANPTSHDVVPPEQVSLALLGDALGDVLLGQRGSRVGRDEPGAVREPRARSRQILRMSEPEPLGFAVVRRIPCAVFRVRVVSEIERKEVLEARPLIVLEGGAVTAPDGDNAPRIVGWLNATGDLIANRARIELTGSVNAFFHVAVSVRDDAAIAVEVVALGGT